MKWTAVFLVLLASSMILIGSSGNFREYESQRGVWVHISQGNESYIAYFCTEGGYSAVVTVEQGSFAEFNALTIRNQLGETLEARIEGDYSALLPDIDVELESGWVTLFDQEEYSFEGNVSVASGVPVGTYTIPIILYGSWDKGDAEISICPLRIDVIAPQVELTKTLIDGNTTVHIKTNQSWTMRIQVTNYGAEREFVIKDVIPAEFEVDLNRTSATNGTYTFTSQGAGDMGSTHMEWRVTVGAGESEYIDITIYTRLNPAGQQEFTSPGTYILNEGAELVGYGIKTDPITVEAVKEGDCCHHHRGCDG
ncbi:COG1470 family protein [Thermococcus sp.]